jgi:predicted ATPase
VQGAHSTRPWESGLSSALMLQRGIGASRWGFFLRAETMHGWYTYFEQTGRGLPPSQRPGPNFHEMSHGESFLVDVGRARAGAALEGVSREPGRYLRHVLD